MKSFWCGAVVPDCSATFTAATDQEVLAQVMAHAQEAHRHASLPDDILDRIRTMIADVT